MLVKNEKNKSYYLYNGQWYWTMSPFSWLGTGVQHFLVNDNGNLSNTGVNLTRGIRPVINLVSDITISGGNGTLDSPFIAE